MGEGFVDSNWREQRGLRQIMTSGADGMPDVVAEFGRRFAGAPAYVVRAPGRVNLIGEHIDYNGLPVLPMAIQREVRLALRPRDDGLVVVHPLSGEFASAEFEVRPGIPRESPGHWSNYVRAPANELARRFAIWRGFDGVLASDIPIAAGLSSSSAIVTAVGLALAHINEVPVDERSFAELMADAEQYTGTRGGGMDQAICMGARTGCAAKLTFNPLRMVHVPIPDEWRFVVADTGVRAEKSGPAQRVYNLRRSECEEAFVQLVQEVVRSSLARTTPRTYADLLRLLGSENTLHLGERVLATSLLRRLRHVVAEAGRVEEAVDLLRSADHSGFGTLMDASHGSLRSDFLVSSAELDELTAIAREGGAAGARLTGAGLGGCVVALADRGTVEEVLETLVREYYEPRRLTSELGQRVFVAVASTGASIEQAH
jgi:galactokinase